MEQKDYSSQLVILALLVLAGFLAVKVISNPGASARAPRLPREGEQVVGLPRVQQTRAPRASYLNAESWEVRRDSAGKISGITIHREAEAR